MIKSLVLLKQSIPFFLEYNMSNIGKYRVIIFPYTGLKSIMEKEVGFATKSLKFAMFQAKLQKIIRRKYTPIAVGQYQEYFSFNNGQPEEALRIVPVEWVVPWPVDKQTHELQADNPILSMSDDDLYNS